MNLSLETITNMAEMGLLDSPKKTEKELRKYIRQIAAINPNILESDVEKIARAIEHKEGIKAGLGAVIDANDFEPWLDDAKSEIKPFYWERYKKLLIKNGLPRDVITATDSITDKILSRLGNPNKNCQWDRRGMVVGHVQSGKTANYTGLITKAADAGYRLIIIIAGIHNNLRNQTQARIDEGFIGRNTGKDKETIGVGLIDPGNTPVSLTNTLRDFNKDTAYTNTSEIDSYKVPVVLVIKKNHRTLTNLLDWLRDNSARGDLEMIDQPMLLIDDEADNASINTKYVQSSKVRNLVTTINGQIRDLLNMFHRKCYIGYTATPFANIFIDPEEKDEMFNEDLFPRDFIIGLDAPSNYFGPSKIFIDGMPDDGYPTWVRYITDNEDVLPVKHKIDHVVNELPDSLLNAFRAFLITRTIRNLRGDKASHCSMLVNASRFTFIQSDIRNRLHEELEKIRNAIRVHAGLGSTALNEPQIASLHAVWLREYSDVFPNWSDIQQAMHDAIASAKVVEVNSRFNDLDYTGTTDRGKTFIAVGGYSLSRGLTLEGLTVTWFLRNSMMYDTLMQMGRWFGYRDGYEDLCRIWMTEQAVEWYEFIANATEELHEELTEMEKSKATPTMFGLAVRSHPATLLVTARNKMGSGKRITSLVGLANKFVETSRVSILTDDLKTNRSAAISLIDKLKKSAIAQTYTSFGVLSQDVPVDVIDEFLAKWRNAEESITTEPEPIRAYIQARKNDELKVWDVLIVSLQNGTPDISLGLPIIPINRSVSPHDLQHGFMSFGGKKMRLASRGIEKVGLSQEKAALAEKTYRKDNNKDANAHINYPDRTYRRYREKALFILYFVKPLLTEEQTANDTTLIPKDPVVAWGLSLPPSNHHIETVQYVVNTVRFHELFGEIDEDDDQEDSLEN